MSEWLTKMTESLKLSPRYIAMAGVFCAFVVFLPTEALAKLGVTALQEDYRTFFGLGLLFSVSVLAIHCALFVKRKIVQRLNLTNLQARLHALTPEEKHLLARYIVGQTRTQKFGLLDGVVAGLEAEHIIVRASSLMHLLEGCPYNIQPWAWDYLNKHPGLVREK